jgi:hypothetical protein
MATLVAEREYLNEFPYTFSFILGPAWAASCALNSSVQLSADCRVSRGNNNKFPYTFSFILGPLGDVGTTVAALAEIVVSFPTELRRGISSDTSLSALSTLSAAIFRNTDAATSTATTVGFPVSILQNASAEGSLFVTSELFANSLVAKYLGQFGISVVASLSSTALRGAKSNASLSILVSAFGSASVEHLKAGFFIPFFYAGSSFLDL